MVCPDVRLKFKTGTKKKRTKKENQKKLEARAKNPTEQKEKARDMYRTNLHTQKQ